MVISFATSTKSFFPIFFTQAALPSSIPLLSEVPEKNAKCSNINAVFTISPNK
jgi:hypothetical protein